MQFIEIKAVKLGIQILLNIYFQPYALNAIQFYGDLTRFI